MDSTAIHYAVCVARATAAEKKLTLGDDDIGAMRALIDRATEFEAAYSEAKHIIDPEGKAMPYYEIFEPFGEVLAYAMAAEYEDELVPPRIDWDGFDSIVRDNPAFRTLVRRCAHARWVDPHEALAKDCALAALASLREFAEVEAVDHIASAQGETPAMVKAHRGHAAVFTGMARLFAELESAIGSGMGGSDAYGPDFVRTLRRLANTVEHRYGIKEG